jgi:hypothetical protein
MRAAKNMSTVSARTGLASGLPDQRGSAAALIVASAGFLMVSLDVTIENVALPTLARSLGASLQELQWIGDAYTVVYTAVLMTGGALGDIFGSRRVFTVGLVVFFALWFTITRVEGVAPGSDRRRRPIDGDRRDRGRDLRHPRGATPRLGSSSRPRRRRRGDRRCPGFCSFNKPVANQRCRPASPSYR